MMANNSNSNSICRVCGEADPQLIKAWWPYKEYQVYVYDCHKCGCRFVSHDPTAHELLHSKPSTYSEHKVIAEKAKLLFDKGDLSGLRRLLVKTKKNRFVLRFIKEHPQIDKIAEIGSSLGYLTSYGILNGKNIIGFDVSQTAVDLARDFFGDNFANINDEVLMRDAPYDLIYHVGTIGCVSDPMAFTDSLLKLLKPGGWLIFNSPNRGWIEQSGGLWPSTRPPDLVTVFPKEFWHRFRSEEIEVITKEESLSVYEWLFQQKHIDKTSNVQATDGVTELLVKRQATNPITRFCKLSASGVLRGIFGRVGSGYLDQYGVHVVMRRKAVTAK